MAKCKYCGAIGFFFPLSGRGLCSACEPLVSMDLENRLRSIEENARLAEQTMNPHSKIVKMRSLIEDLGKVVEYEQRGIDALGGEAAARRSSQAADLDALILATAQGELDDALAKVRRLPSPEAKIKLLEGCLMKLEEYQDRPGGAEARRRFSGRVKSAIYRIRLNARLEEAAAAEEGGEAAGALRLYEEALTYAKSLTDGGEAGKIAAKIKALGGGKKTAKKT